MIEQDLEDFEYVGDYTVWRAEGDKDCILVEIEQYCSKMNSIADLQKSFTKRGYYVEGIVGGRTIDGQSFFIRFRKDPAKEEKQKTNVKEVTTFGI